MEADSEITAWTRICVSHADCILLVGAEDAVYPVYFSPLVSTSWPYNLITIEGPVLALHIALKIGKQSAEDVWLYLNLLMYDGKQQRGLHPKATP